MWNLSRTYEDSLTLLQETTAALEMHKYGAMMEFTGIDIELVASVSYTLSLINYHRGFFEVKYIRLIIDHKRAVGNVQFLML